MWSDNAGPKNGSVPVIISSRLQLLSEAGAELCWVTRNHTLKKKKLVELKILQFAVRIRFECGTGTGIGFLLADK